MAGIGRILIDPPLLNSACAWASDLQQLTELYECRFTGAVTTRTATKYGFKENATHMVLFIKEGISSVNSYGYSPHNLSQYIGWIEEILNRNTLSSVLPKPVIISITSSIPSELSEMISEIQRFRHRIKDHESSRSCIAIEINTSCPNISGAPPPSYTPAMLELLLDVVAEHFMLDETITLGLKLPPYVHIGQFVEMVTSLAKYSRDVNGIERNPVAFLTCTNTLGSSVTFKNQLREGEVSKYDLSLGGDFLGNPFALPNFIGGVGGTSIHSLALGNVLSFSRLLSSSDKTSLRAISIIGVGGVTSPAAVQRMRDAGASAVACATYLGDQGVQAFEILSI